MHMYHAYKHSLITSRVKKGRFEHFLKRNTPLYSTPLELHRQNGIETAQRYCCKLCVGVGLLRIRQPFFVHNYRSCHFLYVVSSR